MEALIIFIAKSSGLLLLFYCTYFFLLRKETFFNSNRWFLLAGLIISITLPLLVFTKTVWIDPAPATDLNTTIFNSSSNAATENLFLNWENLLILVYGIGFLALAIKFAIDFYRLSLVLKGKKIKQQADFKFIDTNENIAPFSYFEYIVYNSSMYSATELESILEHEKVHSDQNHTIDVLISRAFCILFWFNPIAWLYKKAITQNLEFIADNEAAKKITDKKAYQYTLLKITTHSNCVAITNHFYQSLIKKRIVMLNKNQSKKRNSWKYYVVIPALAAFVLLFQIEVVAKEKQQTTKESSGDIKSVDVYKIKKSSTDAQLQEIKEKLKSIHNIDFEASEIKRNADNNLISIKIDIKNGNQKTQSIQTSSKVIEDFGVLVITDKNGVKRVGIQTDDKDPSKGSKVAVSKKLKTEDNEDSEKSTNSHIVITNNQNSKTDTNVNINSSTSTKVNSDTNANISTIITTDSDNKVTTKVITVGGKTKVAVSNSGKNANQSGNPLVIIDGEEMPSDFNLQRIDSKNVETISVFKGTEAVNRYGEKGSNGVIEIESKK
ncbi:M56 family metallopeptidase [Flavobacterium foetidum]|uniref:M56 family metallopeptidase n=1 Tax=Flavobacterium foetidum TaxID=2026681 RepID=UPI001074B378|nr:M56 family metallopeptidase [Flavobacterium foetidum]KAF2513941.1 TonB-dependent receptor plug domain-containing protein [Flavobacterium foetidum]